MTMIVPNVEPNASFEDGRWYPLDTGTWTDLPTWDEFGSWYTGLPATAYYYMDMVTPPLSIGEKYNLQIETKANGIVHYVIYTSDGTFTGEEITTTIASGATNVSGFVGANAYIVVCVDRVSGINYLEDVQITVTNEAISESQYNVDTSLLGGTITARELATKRKFSIINEIQISVHEVSPYALDLYVSNYSTSKTLIARVVDESIPTPTIALTGIDGSNKDGIVDFTIKGLPEQYMSGNNLLTR